MASNRKDYADFAEMQQPSTRFSALLGVAIIPGKSISSRGPEGWAAASWKSFYAVFDAQNEASESRGFVFIPPG
ncbi:MAG: hypothetical protein JWM11_3080 [Planctomycetaceae bacterium]|nr:hypothetical protein [Planctomycetaceae bacterium]